ncbi:rhodanese-like domain-containing protein [Mucilaginibacter sp. BT774]|uniref:rhodanese-like domain-containing protein n=1 Tax=Mucilaginibacter sp. BT774 TaxID=3062276 RepID=UPI0026750048|nr:rhodanese-like domain-containing protein [Mucilaginibacter sp. BT774]MDO3628562.1 rhodanese-like domain-containing protein [Mucilaginibacter sp. BT774]
MFDKIKKILGIGPKVDFGELIANGAVIVDVRSSGEYSFGHLNKSVNMPLDTLKVKLGKLKKDTPVITCCASGMRSSMAKKILLANGFKQVHNGGSWFNLKRYEE